MYTFFQYPVCKFPLQIPHINPAAEEGISYSLYGKLQLLCYRILFSFEAIKKIASSLYFDMSSSIRDTGLQISDVKGIIDDVGVLLPLLFFVRAQKLKTTRRTVILVVFG